MLQRVRGTLRAAGIAVSLGALGLVAATRAWGEDDQKPPTLHADLPAPPATSLTGSGDSDDQPIFGADPATGQNPTAFADDGKILPKPNSDPKPAPDEPVFGTKSFAADRDTEWNPDYQTGPENTLQYVTVFNPTVIPFKRMSAMDAVKDDYTLYTASGAGRTELRVGGTQTVDRDLFWGSLAIHLETGTEVPIPSVSPDMRILSYEVSPRKVKLSFSKDGADNFYVRSDEPGVSGDFRLVFLADAGAGYFGAPVPSGYRVSDLAGMRDAPDMQPLPPRAQSMAERGLRNLGIHRGMPLHDALDKLVYYFRAFEAKKPPTPTGDVYWDLFVSQAGVCRHRSFAFMITANALGVPTRYVTNEAHAWVEVWLPDIHWMRVDLGGAALKMNVSGANDKTVYQPRDRDDFSEPPSYSNGYTQLQGDINGLSQQQIDDARSHDKDNDVDLSSDSDPDPDADTDDDPDTGPRVGPGKSLPTLPQSALKDKVRTSIGVGSADTVGYRGESMRVRGTLARASGGTAVAGMRVDIYLAPAGQGGDDAVLVGNTTTAADGSFDVQVDLPREIDLGTYEVFAASPGDSTYSPAVSQ